MQAVLIVIAAVLGLASYVFLPRLKRFECPP